MKKLIFNTIMVIVCFAAPFVGYWKGYDDSSKGYKSIFTKEQQINFNYATITGLNTSEFFSGDIIIYESNGSGSIRKLKAEDTVDFKMIVGFVTYRDTTAGSINVFIKK